MARSNVAALINSAHEKVEAARQAVAENAMECGRLLCEAKETVAHGEWDEWVRRNCTFAPRTAQLYMRVYRQLAADPAKAQRVAGLSLREIDRELASKSPAAASDSREETADRLLGLWWLAGRSGRIKFVHQIHQRGDITDEQRVRLLASGLGIGAPS